MTGTLRVLRAEAYRLLHGWPLRVTAAFLVFACLARVAVAWTLHTLAHGQATLRALDAGREPPAFEPGNAWRPLVDAWSTGLVLGGLLLLVAASLSLAGDRERGVLRLATTRSASRTALVLGRALLGVPLVLGVAALTGLASWAGAAAGFEFGPLVEYDYEIASSAELGAQLRAAALAALPPLYAAWCFGLCVSSLVRGPIFAVSASLVLYLGFDLFKGALGDGQYWVFAAFAPSFVDSSYMGEMARIAVGLSDAVFPEELLRMNMIVPWPEAALLVTLACAAMSRKTL